MMNNQHNNAIVSSDMETDQLNIPHETEEEWSLRFMDALPQNNRDQSEQFINIPNEYNDDDLTSESSSAATTILIDDETIQQNEISSSTPTISTLNVINSTENQTKNLWILIPALNSIYSNLISKPTCHFKNTTGAYQMEISKAYDNGLLTPLTENTCHVQSNDMCPMKTIQSSLYHLMLAMKNYSTLKSEEKESLVLNFNYLSYLVTTIEAGFRAQREWNMIIQSLSHRNSQQSSNCRDVESIDLEYQVKRTTQRCLEPSINEQQPLTTLFDQYQKTIPSMENHSDLSHNEIEAHKMYTMMTTIEEMLNRVNNNISFV